jgi:hypothetical protein
MKMMNVFTRSKRLIREKTGCPDAIVKKTPNNSPKAAAWIECREAMVKEIIRAIINLVLGSVFSKRKLLLFLARSTASTLAISLCATQLPHI